MKILFLTKYNIDGPSSRYRFYNYRSFFENAKIRYHFKPLFSDDYIADLYNDRKYSTLLERIFSILRRFFFLLFNSSKYDLLVIEKELFPNLPYFFEFFLLKGKVYALDFDDYIATSYKNNKYKRFFLYNKIDKLVNAAKFVTVGNRWYFEEFKTDNLCYLPTVINLNDYPKPKNDFSNTVVTIVWIGSPSTAKYLSIVTPAIQKLSKNYPIKLKVIGAIVSIDGVTVENVKWSAKTESDELSSSDIGIMPLEDTLWEKGKCGFKLIQYMASGLPVVATSAPANNEIITNGVNGFIIYNVVDWYNKLEELVVNKSLREQFGKLSRNRVEADYSYQVWGHRFVKILKNV